MKKLTFLFIATALILSSCSSEDDSNAKGTSGNILVLNGKEYEIGSLLSYSEADNDPAAFYYYDLTFLSNDLDYNFTNDGDLIIDGTGSLLGITLLSETKLLKEGKYEFDVADKTPFYTYGPFAILDYTYNNLSLYNDVPENDVDYFSDDFDSVIINVERNGDSYSISGSGTFNGLSFSIDFTGDIQHDPDSEI